jgi:hypothetical protein
VKGVNCILAEAVGPSHCPYVFVFKEKEGSHVNVHKKEFLLVYYIKKKCSHKLNNAFSEKKRNCIEGFNYHTCQSCICMKDLEGGI